MKVSSLLDRIVVLVCLACIATCGLVKLRTQRTHARAIKCRNNLRQIGLGFHNYHSAYKRLPMGSGGTDRGSVDEPMLGNANRLSAMVGITPFMLCQQIW